MSLNPTKQFGFQLWVTTQERQRLLNQTLKSHDLTHAQYMVMQFLYRADQKKKLADLSQNQIAQSMGLNTMMMSNILTALEKKNMIIRTKSADTGGYTIGLTDHGSLMVIQAHAAVTKFEEALFDDHALSSVMKHFDQLIKKEELKSEEQQVKQEELSEEIVEEGKKLKKDKKHKKDKKKKKK